MNHHGSVVLFGQAPLFQKSYLSYSSPRDESNNRDRTDNHYYIEDSSLEYLYRNVKYILSVHTLLHCCTNHRGQMEKEDTAPAYNEIGAGSFVPTLIPSFPYIRTYWLVSNGRDYFTRYRLVGHD